MPMFRYKLRTLLIVLALGPPVLAAGWWGWGEWREHRRIRQIIEQERQSMQFGRYMQEDRPPDEDRSDVPDR